ncbi:MAG TPA: TIM-barrel domain-containing protein, partial [Solirubrobacteraceae bacterium]|nr:TIM-barrel domain-containing protein [Solirubrobacteraceae bacterium]
MTSYRARLRWTGPTALGHDRYPRTHSASAPPAGPELADHRRGALTSFHPTLRSVVLAASVAIISAGSARAEPPGALTVSSGALVASISPNPWQLVFRDARGTPVVTESTGLGLGRTGTLGFESGGGAWYHATRVLTQAREGSAWTATVATTDPGGRSLAVRLEPDGEGVLRLTASVNGPVTDVTSTGIGFQSPGGERFLGFGERSNAVDQGGGTVESFVGERPHQPEERPFVPVLAPPWAYHPREDATYWPIPWMLSTRGYGVLVDNNDTSYFYLRSDQPDAWSAQVASAQIALRVFAGPSPAQALGRYSARLGRQPPAAAPWFFGPWFQPPGDDKASLKTLRQADAPVSVGQTYTHYLPCGDQQGREAAQRQRTALWHANGLAITTYFNPMICTSYHPAYDQAAAAGVLGRNETGQPYVYRYTTANLFLVSQFDFSAPGADAFYGRLLAEAVGHGYDGWMEDFGEYTPPDISSYNAMSGPQMHNYYPVLYHRAANEYSNRAPRPLARFNRSGWTGAARYSQLVWGGDPTADWGADGLASAVRNGLSMGLSGVSLWGSDIGGYFADGTHTLTPELLARWIEFGSVSGIMRTETDGFSIPAKSRPQVTDPGILPVWRRYAKLRTQLYPYLTAAEAVYDRTGIPLMRYLALAYPTDERASGRDDEYLFGPDLLAAPVIAPGAQARSLYLPAGQWVDLWRSATFQEGPGALHLGRARVLGGASERTLPAPLNELPLL